MQESRLEDRWHVFLRETRARKQDKAEQTIGGGGGGGRYSHVGLKEQVTREAASQFLSAVRRKSINIPLLLLSETHVKPWT
jgi:hypothetical protein